MAQLFAQAAQRGVVVKGLIWRSHLDTLAYSEAENRNLSETSRAAGGEVLLDQRVRRGGSHHQKLVVLRHPGAPERDVAFAGGIDLCHSRRDDAAHGGDPQPVQMSPRYGPQPALARRAARAARAGGRRAGHHCSASAGPTRCRWTRRTRWRTCGTGCAARTCARTRCPSSRPTRPPCGPHQIQVLRTYPAVRPRYSFAPTASGPWPAATPRRYAGPAG